MGNQELQQKKRILSVPADYTFSEAEALLTRIGFTRYNKGRTSGSRVMFYRESDGKKILLHKPHPGDVMKKAAVRDLKKALIEYGDLHEE